MAYSQARKESKEFELQNRAFYLGSMHGVSEGSLVTVKSDGSIYMYVGWEVATKCERVVFRT